MDLIRLLSLLAVLCTWHAALAKKVLFLTNSESGLGNVALATSHALLLGHPDVEVYLSSFASLAPAVNEVSSAAQAQLSTSRAIHWMPLNGSSFSQSLLNVNFSGVDAVINAPGLHGQTKFLQNIQSFLLPWSGPDFVQIYLELRAYIDLIEPDVLVLDTIFSPAIDAARDSGRKRIMLSANQLKDHFSQTQPFGEMFWKIPAMNSAYPYPVPWRLIPYNIILNVRLIYNVLVGPALTAKKKYIKSQGLHDPANFFQTYSKDVPFISPSVPELEYPLVIPDNVICTGPIYLETESVASRDPSLDAWLRRGRTVLINLGSSVDYNETDAMELVNALKPILDEQSDLQILWKFRKRHPYSDNFLVPVQNHIDSGRFRLEKWLTVDPAAILASGHIAVFVHHGGANSFYEGLASGVPTIVLPLWADLYDYAQRTEWLGVGIWASQKTAPRWFADELGDAFAVLLNGTSRGRAIAQRAAMTGDIARSKGGRRAAAQVIADVLSEKDGSSTSAKKQLDSPDHEL